jgi:hypothetical protein
MYAPERRQASSANALPAQTAPVQQQPHPADGGRRLTERRMRLGCAPPLHPVAPLAYPARGRMIWATALSRGVGCDGGGVQRGSREQRTGRAAARRHSACVPVGDSSSAAGFSSTGKQVQCSGQVYCDSAALKPTMPPIPGRLPTTVPSPTCWSSISMPANPAAAYPATVRLTFTALPYPVSPSPMTVGAQAVSRQVCYQRRSAPVAARASEEGGAKAAQRAKEPG